MSLQRTKLAWVLASVFLGTLGAPWAGAQQEATEPLNPIGKLAPLFAGKSLDGKEISLADYQGKAVLVHFWATSCEECKRQLRWLANARERYAKQGFEVLAILADKESEAEARNLVTRYHIRYPILASNPDAAKKYGGIRALPTSFYIGCSGKVVLEETGFLSRGEIEANVRELLGLSGAASARSKSGRRDSDNMRPIPWPDGVEAACIAEAMRSDQVGLATQSSAGRPKSDGERTVTCSALFIR